MNLSRRELAEVVNVFPGIPRSEITQLSQRGGRETESSGSL